MFAAGTIRQGGKAKVVQRFAQRQLRMGATSLLISGALVLAYILGRRAVPPQIEPFDPDDVILPLMMLLNAVTALALIRAARMVGRTETQRSSAEREAQRRGAWLESLVENMPVGVGVIEGTKGDVILSNALYRKLLRSGAPAEPTKQAHRNLRIFDRQGRPLDYAQWPSSRALRLGETVRDAEVQIESDGGERLWMSVSAAPIRGDPQEAAAVVAFSDITDRKRAEKERESLLHRLVEVQEEERLHFARELHDELGQELTALLIGLKGVEAAMAEPERDAQLRDMRSIVGRMNDQVHHLAGNLRPLILEDLGLRPAIEELALSWGTKLGLEIDLLLDGLEAPLPPEASIAIYRVLQEALTNIARHSRARSVSITARGFQGVLRIAVEDDGCGFDPASLSRVRLRRNGLVGMRERLAGVGGTLIVESQPGQGTTVYASIPVGGLEGRHDANTDISDPDRG